MIGGALSAASTAVGRLASRSRRRRKPTSRLKSRRGRRTGPQLSPNPGRTARFYRSNRRSRLKRRRAQARINNTPAKRSYRRNLMRIRRKRNPGPQTDMSHRRGRVVSESRKQNRGRGGAFRR